MGTFRFSRALLTPVCTCADGAPSDMSVEPAELCENCRRTQLYREFLHELAPVGAIENVLVAELARRAANMEWWSTAAGAVRNNAARTLAELVIPNDSSCPDASASIAAAASCDALDRAERTSTAQSRAFSKSLRLLMDIQARRLSVKSAVPATIPQLPDIFCSESGCVEYLVGWQHHNFECQTCGGRDAHFFHSRVCLQCVTCRTQSGLRVGTVMADSPLPLVNWFSAIWHVISNPSITSAELQQHLPISRSATVRAMANRIRGALTADNRTALVVGLDRYFCSAEPSVRFAKNCNAALGFSDTAAIVSEIVSPEQLTGLDPSC